jgi:two-component system nitrogen regulation response regulator NtrX
VQHFVTQLSETPGLAKRTFSAAAVDRLKRHPWPGNVRELRNSIERLLILAAGPEIQESDVARLLGPVHQGDGAPSADGLLDAETYEAFKVHAERAFLLAKLTEFDWNVSETARRLDMPRSNLYKKIERLKLMREP